MTKDKWAWVQAPLLRHPLQLPCEPLLQRPAQVTALWPQVLPPTFCQRILGGSCLQYLHPLVPVLAATLAVQRGDGHQTGMIRDLHKLHAGSRM